jgi:hypothetical protein
MYKIKIKDQCSCTKKSKKWNKDLEFESFKEAKDVAKEMVKSGNKKFCKKHKFKVIDDGKKVVEIVKK